MTGHYFDAAPTSDDRRRDVTVRLAGRDVTMTTAAGTFSPDGLDKATSLLLDSDLPRAGRVLDLGCGWGPVATAIALAGDAEVWAVDVNTRALDLTALNADRLGLAVHTSLPDDVPADLTFDAIWSNPPIRIGKAALHDLLLHWLDRLTPRGEARWVVGKNLGADSLQRWLTDRGWPTERLSSARGFRVLRTAQGISSATGPV